MDRKEPFAIAIRGEMSAVEKRTRYVAQRMRECDPCSGTQDEICARFPERHSCQYCQEEVIRAFQVNPSRVTFLRNVDQAIEAATHGCSLYTWLLDFVIRARGSELVGEEGLLLHRELSPGSKNDV
jgi:hypothetical protein